MDQFEAMSMPRITQKSPIAYTVETPRGEHPSLQLKRSSPAENRGPCRPTDSLCPMLYAALITTIPPLAIYLENLPTYSGIFCYITLHRKKLVVRVRDIIAGENKTE